MKRECIPEETARDVGRAVRPLGLGDAEYPVLLREVPAAPGTLYVRGRLVAGDALAVAVVGSRRATAYGLGVAEALAADLAARGVTIVSGLARGIDSAAHRAALRAGGRTIAVLGSGVDVVYPPENRRLAVQITEQGALLSQFAPGTPPLPQHFPARNGVIAGLSLAVVVVEAAEKSGALITARLAAELGREVAAVPGRITAPESRGVHRLIQDGAALVTGWEDLVALLPAPWQACLTRVAGRGAAAGEPSGYEGGRGAAVAGRGEPSASRADTEIEPSGYERTEAPDTPDAQRLLALLGDEPVDIDAVIERSGLGPGRVSAALLGLELDGRVSQIEGKRFIRLGRE